MGHIQNIQRYSFLLIFFRCCLSCKCAERKKAGARIYSQMKNVVWCCTFVYNGCTVVAQCYLISVQQYCGGGFPHRMYVYERTEFKSLYYSFTSLKKNEIYLIIRHCV